MIVRKRALKLVGRVNYARARPHLHFRPFLNGTVLLENKEIRTIPCRGLATSERIKVVVNNEERFENTVEQGESTYLESSVRVSSKIEEISPGGLKEVDIREVCRALNDLAHSYNKKECSKDRLYQRGNIAWSLFCRLLVEDNLFDTANDTLLPIHGYPVIIDHALCHSAIKCMVQSNDESLFQKAETVISALEEHYIQSQSKKIRPVGRSYALLIDALQCNKSKSDDDLVKEVKNVLDRVENQEASGNSHVSMNRHIFNAALDALASRSESSAAIAEMIEDMITKDGAPIDQVSFSIAMKAILSSRAWLEKTENKAASIESLLVKMETFNLLPSQITMTPILGALSNEGNVDEVLHLLKWMEDMYQQRGWDHIRPNKIHFNTIINAISRSNISDRGDKAMQILGSMKSFHASGDNEGAKPDLVTYNSVLNVIAKEGDSNDSKRGRNENNNFARAEALLTKMQDGLEGVDIAPDLVSYNTVLSSYMKSTSANAAIASQNLLQRMSDYDIEPDMLSYTMCINTLGKSRLTGSAQKAEDLLRVLEKEYAAGNTKLKPDMMCYNSIVHAHANSSEKDGIFKAYNILREMETLQKSGNRPDLIPDAVSYTSVISTLARQDDKRHADILNDIVSMIQDDNSKASVDSGVYNALIHAQSVSGGEGSAQKAEDVLLSMLNSNISDGSVRPNTITFNTVIDAWSKSDQKGAADRAEMLLNKMQQLHQEGYEDISPDTFSFASVLNALANSPDNGSAEKAEKVLQMQQQLFKDGNKRVKPNTVCFATVIKAFSRSKVPGSAEKSESILREMFESHEEGNMDVRPNTIAFTTVCNAWATFNSPKSVKKVEELIAWMEDLSANGFKDVSPNAYTYNALLTAVARSKDPHKATKALEILKSMQNNPNLRLNSITYSNVMSACSYTHGTASIRNNALKTAIVVLEEAVEKAGPRDRLNTIYGAFFQTCSNLMQKEKEKVKIERIVEAVFHQCCKNGQVDKMLLIQVRRACSQQIYLNLFGNFNSFPKVNIRDIPSEWQRNVQRRKK